MQTTLKHQPTLTLAASVEPTVWLQKKAAKTVDAPNATKMSLSPTWRLALFVSTSFALHAVLTFALPTSSNLTSALPTSETALPWVNLELEAFAEPLPPAKPTATAPVAQTVRAQPVTAPASRARRARPTQAPAFAASSETKTETETASATSPIVSPNPNSAIPEPLAGAETKAEAAASLAPNGLPVASVRTRQGQGQGQDYRQGPAQASAMASAIHASTQTERTGQRDLLRGWRRSIRGMISANYPRAAQRAHLEGTVRVALRIDAQGRILQKRIQRSCGHDILDRAALASVTSLQRVPHPPQALDWRENELTVNVRYIVPH